MREVYKTLILLVAIVPLLVGGSPGSRYDKQVFTSNGTWVKPSWANLVEVRAMGGGGGGGSGQVRAFNANGGAGGAGGSKSVAVFQANDLPASVAVTVGVGGAGGAGVTGSTANPGQDGGTSSFGSYLSARGGSGGSGGDYSAGTPGGLPSAGMYIGGAGTLAINLAGIAQTNCFNGGAAGGGSGGGFTSSRTGREGKDAGDCWGDFGRVIGSPAGAVATDGPHGTNTVDLTECNPGSSGGGGGSEDASGSHPGGNGGLYGGAGGGGSTAETGSTTGAGGHGTNGVVIVISYEL